MAESSGRAPTLRVVPLTCRNATTDALVRALLLAPNSGPSSQLRPLARSLAASAPRATLPAAQAALPRHGSFVSVSLFRMRGARE